MARKILLADDSVTAQNMGRKILADAGYEVTTVNNGSAALKKIGEQKPDLIVLDVYMPGYSGLEVCQRLKEVGDTSRIPVLLTVGKLEPFKPEEARRVRADGYIVKPFEASELLSALSKLEDKIVPRSEPSKPGRFARATAAIEESRYDKSMAADEDSGWKSRIGFPKKKEKPPEPEVEDAAIYNPVNKDLRTVIEHKDDNAPAAKVETQAEREEERVNLGALAPEGLPKDVTPEEIAALAAAAAQVKSTLEEHKMAEEIPASPAPATAEIKKKEEGPVAEPVAASTEAIPGPESAVTLAEQPKSEEPKKEAEPEVTATPSEVMAAIVGLEHQSNGGGSENGSTSSNQEKADEPVTMALAAAAAGASSSHWTAVAVALAPEEASLSLEQEMQKSYAAFAAAEAVRTEAAPAAPAVSGPVSAAISEPVAVAIPEPVLTAAAMIEAPTATSMETPASASIPAAPASESASPFTEVARAAKEAVTAAINEFESAAASYLAQEPAAPVEPASVGIPETAASLNPEPAPAVEAKSAEPVVADSLQASETPVEIKPAESESKGETTTEAEAKPAEINAKSEEAEPKSAEPAPSVEAQPAVTVPEQSIGEKNEITESVAEATAPAPKEMEVSETQVGAKETVAEIAATEAISPIAGGIEEMAKKESENTAAAAWASWRKIRETGNSKPAQDEPAKESEESTVTQDSAAMAVAVGAESSPEDVNKSLDSDPEISSIVDSVLADMRPKIVEEIARKLGKKK